MIPPERSLDTVTANEWRISTVNERHDFIERERAKGIVSFVCIMCGFPTSRGMAGCDSCAPFDLVKNPPATQ